jgi:hypothetical protein
MRALVDGGPTAEPFMWWVGWMVLLFVVFVVTAVRSTASVH